MPTNPVRYNAKDAAKALGIQGFAVRDPEGANVMYCLHGMTRAEFWLPKTAEGVREDVLENILDNLDLPLPIDFFKSVYASLVDDNKYPPDQC